MIAATLHRQTAVMSPLGLPSWLKIKPKGKVTTRLHVAKVKFLGEQDGPVERTIKAQWSAILSTRPEIRRAFLVRASYDGSNDMHVVLALCSTASADSRLLEALRVPYAAIFHRDCPLDMVFADFTQESHIEKVCPPFYTAA
jgi:hypothetical protein